MKMKYAYYLLMVAGFAIGSAQAQLITHFDHVFDGNATTDLDGTLEDHSGAAWTASGNFNINTDGSFGSVGVALGASATLDFTPVSGRIYTLDTRLSEISDNWAGMGFAEGSGGNAFNHGGGANERAWMFMRHQKDAGVSRMEDGNTSGAVSTFGNKWSDEDGGIDMRIVLDTQSATWQATWYVKGILETEYTEVWSTRNLVNQNIDSVGLTANGSASGTFDSFKLTSIPEPGTTWLLLSGMMGLFALRRHLRS